MKDNPIQLGIPHTLVKFTEKGLLDCYHFIPTHMCSKWFPKRNSYGTLIVISGDHDMLKWNKYIHIFAGEQFVIWAGTHQISTTMISDQIPLTINGNHVTLQRKWPFFDARYLLRAKSEVAIQPIAELINPLGVEKLIEVGCISQQNKPGIKLLEQT